MTIILTAGGSGGHITPILAVAEELKRQDSTHKIIYIGQKGDNLADLPKKDPNIDEVLLIRAGKFRRFHGEGIQQIFNIRVLIQNIRDFFYVIIGIIQSRRLLKQIHPSIVFSRGGYVSVPVALGAKLNNIPYITHDSDLVPSLANRIIERWAVVHAVALPKELYPYPPDKTITTGIPINKKFVPVTSKIKEEYRKELSLKNSDKVLFIIGGGLGSQIVNNAFIEVAPHLLSEYKELQICHIVGGNNLEEAEDKYQENLDKYMKGRVKIFDYIPDVYRYSGAADVIITRAGATNLAEFAAQGKACIIIPSGFLVGGHQLKNAEYLNEQNAAIVINEVEMTEDSNRLAKLISDLLSNKQKQNELEKNLSKFALPNAAEVIRDLIVKYGEK